MRGAGEDAAASWFVRETRRRREDIVREMVGYNCGVFLIQLLIIIQRLAYEGK